MVSMADILGVILAGGQARRMTGRDKALIEVAGKPLLGHVVDRFAPQVGTLVLSANGDPERFEVFGLAVVPDTIDECGPLAGILSAMEWASANAPDAQWIASVAVDTPLLPRDLVDRLSDAISGDGAGDGRAAIAASNGRMHPVCGLFNIALAADLRAYLEGGGRKVEGWTQQVGAQVVEFDTVRFDPFFNVNKPADLDDGRLADALKPG